MGTKATESMIYLFIIEIVNYLHFIPYYFNQLLFKEYKKMHDGVCKWNSCSQYDVDY